jgi:hypothetical protein
MATVTIEPAFYLNDAGATITTQSAGERIRAIFAAMPKPTIGQKVLPLFTSDALATARAEGRAEGMREADKIAAAQECWCESTNSTDPVRAFNTGADAMRGAIHDAILAAIPQETKP